MGDHGDEAGVEVVEGDSNRCVVDVKEVTLSNLCAFSEPYVLVHYLLIHLKIAFIWLSCTNVCSST